MTMPYAPSDAWLTALRTAMRACPDVDNAPGSVVDRPAEDWHKLVGGGADGVVMIRALEPAALEWLSSAVDRWVARGAGGR